MHAPPPSVHPLLGDWVELRSEDGRAGRRHHLVVNRRHDRALILDDRDVAQVDAGRIDDPDLASALAEGGFLAGGPEPDGDPVGGHVARFLRTFDVHWRGADRWITRLHDRGFRYAWERPAMTTQCVVAAAGLVALIALLRSDRPLVLRPSPWEVPVYVLLSLVAIAVHELAHGLVIVHHGRRVSAVGFRLHLGSPSCYVESVDALLLTRRQRIVQAAAGPWAEWLVLSVVATASWLVPLGALGPIVHRFVLLGAVTIATNLLPFAGLDGSLILADALGEPHLAHESRRAVARRRRGRGRGDGLLLAYAAANTVVSGLLLATSVVFWWVLFGGVVTRLASYGPFGRLGAGALLVVSFGPWLSTVGPHLRRFGLLDRLVFRLERRRRVRLTRRFAAVAPFDELDERGLGVLAGQLRLHRVHRSAPLHVAGFRGVLAADGPLLLGRAALPVPAGVAVIDGSGLAARSRRWLASVEVGLLPSDSLQILGLDHRTAAVGRAAEPATVSERPDRTTGGSARR